MKLKSLLIVEPDMAIRHPLAEYLRECGYKVIEAASTDEALQVLKSREALIDIVLADVNAPGEVDGFGLAKWIREQPLASQVILAGTVSKAAEKAGELCEEGPLLAKPYHHQTLLDRIKGMIADRDRMGGREA